MLVIDETGFLEKGRHSAGVKRQYSGTARRVENGQIGVFLAYDSGEECNLLDRELYLPQEGINDQQRRQQAGIPDSVDFITKPVLARQMLERAFAAGVPAQWVTGDSLHRGDSQLRGFWERRGRAYVLAVTKTHTVWYGSAQQSVETLAAAVSDSSAHASGAAVKKASATTFLCFSSGSAFLKSVG